MAIDPRELRSKSAAVTVVQTDRPCSRCGYNLRGLPMRGKCPECGQPVGEVGRANVAVVEVERPCARCGYELRGLPTDGRCPECGLPIGGRRDRFRRLNNNLSDAPLPYLRVLRLGLAMMALCAVLSVAAFFILGAHSALARAVGVGAAAIGWMTGVFIVTSQRPIDENTPRDATLDSARLRSVNRWVQGAWPAAGLAMLMAARLPGVAGAGAAWVAVALMVAGLLGLVPLAVHLSALADWAGHTALGGRFRVAAWVMTVMGVLVVVAGGAAGFQTLAGFLLLALSGAVIVVFGAQLLLFVCLVQLQLTVWWAIRNSEFAAGRLERMVERAQRGGGPERECARCGYSLRGLPVMARCPECGHIDEQMRGSAAAALASIREVRTPREDEGPIPLAEPDPEGPGKIRRRP